MSSTTPGAEFLDNPAKDKADEPSIDDIAAAAVRTPSSRLREKISRDGVAPESADEEKSTVSASDDDRQVKSNVENVPAVEPAAPATTSTSASTPLAVPLGPIEDCSGEADNWMQNFCELKNYRNKFGDCNVSFVSYF